MRGHLEKDIYPSRDVWRTLCGHISPGIYVRTMSFFGFQLRMPTGSSLSLTVASLWPAPVRLLVGRLVCWSVPACWLSADLINLILGKNKKYHRIFKEQLARHGYKFINNGPKLDNRFTILCLIFMHKFKGHFCIYTVCSSLFVQTYLARVFKNPCRFFVNP